MSKIARIGIDTSKGSFQLHGVDGEEQVVLRKALRRKQFLEYLAKQEVGEIGLEACGASHHRARALRQQGHRVVLVPPQYVKGYVARGKNDKNDAEAICEAMSRRRVRERLVPVKTLEQSAGQMLMKVRSSLIERRTQLTNSLRGHAAEFGLVAAKGVDKIGPIGACLWVTKVVDPHAFRSARSCAAWLGLTPKDRSTAGKQRLGGITRAGDESLRATLVLGATAHLRHVRSGRIAATPWLAGMLARKPPKLVAVALANKTARIAWKLMISGERYDRAHQPTRKGLDASQSGERRAEPLAAV